MPSTARFLCPIIFHWRYHRSPYAATIGMVGWLVSKQLRRDHWGRRVNGTWEGGGEDFEPGEGSEGMEVQVGQQSLI